MSLSETTITLPADLRKGRLTPWPNIVLALGFVGIVTLLAVSYYNVDLGETSLKTINASSARVERLDRLKQDILDAETGLRGYMLMGDETFLAPYRAGIPRVMADMAEIKRTYDLNNPLERDEIDRMEHLLSLQLAIMDDAYREVRRTGFMEKRSLIYASKSVMDEFRASRLRLRDAMVLNHKNAIEQSMYGFNVMRGVAFILGIFTLVLLLIWFAAIKRQLRLQDALDRTMRDRNLALEATVHERTEELVSLASYLANAREAEKAHLARELHDEFGALLTAAKHDTGWVERKLPETTPPAIRERLGRLQQTLGSIITLQRNIINNLRPAILADLGLITALRHLIEEYTSLGDIKVNARLPESELDLNETSSLALFRIVQEAFTNTRKYANASEILLELFEDGTTIVLNIYDNGQGFDQTSPTIARHGLAGMRHRVHMLKGKLEIVSSPGRGVMITVEMPNPKA
jgi:signal transduction histidine kinase